MAEADGGKQTFDVGFGPIEANDAIFETGDLETPRTLRGRFATQSSLAFNRDTLLEDNIALTLRQEVMESGAKQVVQFGEQEIQCRPILRSTTRSPRR